MKKTNLTWFTLIIAAMFFVTPTAYADSDVASAAKGMEKKAENMAKRDAKKAEHEKKKAERKAKREAKKAEKKAKHEAKKAEKAAESAVTVTPATPTGTSVAS